MTYRTLTMIAPAAAQSTVNQLAAGFDSDTGGARTFDFFRLSESGAEPASHAGVQVLISAERLAQIVAIKQSGSVPPSLRGTLTQSEADAALALLQIHEDRGMSELAADLLLHVVSTES